MSQQLTITNFFKTKVHSAQRFNDMENLKRKKRNLSLIKSPSQTKSPKIRIEDKHVVADVSLLSDDDDDFVSSPPKLRLQNLSQQSNDSDKTVIYSVSPQTPKKTPQKTPSTSTAKISPGSRDKFFSPSKKRSVKKRTPTKIRRNLAKELSRNADGTEDLAVSGFDQACQGLDDKSKFCPFVIILKVHIFIKVSDVGKYAKTHAH